MSLYERLVFVVALVVAGLGFSLLLAPPYVWILAVALIVVVCVGTDSLVRSHPKTHLHHTFYSLTFCILPALLTLGSMLFLRLVVGAYWLVGGLLFTGVLLAIVLLAEYHTVDLEAEAYGLARSALNLVSYLAAFSLFAAIYQSRARTIQSATPIWIISALLALELFRESEAEARRTWLYAFVAGLVVAETTWGLNYWAIGGLTGGAFLLLVFYLATGIIQHYLAGKLNRQLVIEFSAVSALGLVFLASSRFWLR